MIVSRHDHIVFERYWRGTSFDTPADAQSFTRLLAAHADCCMLAHQGDWIRLGQLLVRDGNYRGEELIRPGWVTLLRTPTRADPQYGAYLRLAATEAPGVEPYAAADLFAVEGAGGNRMWLVPSLQLVILCTGAPQGRDAAWSESRIPNLVVRSARDFHPRGPRHGEGLSTLVPGH